jgi:UDP-N-acetylglucosamine 1-carboxyvinyltransferase
MPGIIIEGGTPLMGSVNVSGAKNSASKLIYASMFSNEDIVLNNVPRIQTIMDDIEVIKSVGGEAEWLGTNTLSLNGSKIPTHEIPQDIGSRLRTSLLFVGPLLFRFGKAFIPKHISDDGKTRPVNRFIDTWNSLGFRVEEDEFYLKIFIDGAEKGSNINFKNVSHTATDNAILSSVFLQRDVSISNASEDTEVDDLVELLNLMGADIKRPEAGKIEVLSPGIFKEAMFEVGPDKSEVAAFASLAVLTGGNISIKSVKRESVLQFVNFLNKINARFEFSENELRVWRHSEELKPMNLEVTASPGFIHDWQPLAVLMLTQANGESTVHEKVYVDRFGYCLDLNRMGARIDLVTPSEAGLEPYISDDSYDMEISGEPKTVAKISGPTKLRGERLTIENFKYGPVLVLAALAAEGKSEVIGIENISYYCEDFIDKLISLGAKIWEQSD